MTLFGKPVGEQLLDIAGHVVWGGLTGAALAYGALDFASWQHRIFFWLGSASGFAIIVRGIRQLPPNPARPYDPLLDGAGFMIGASIGILTVLCLTLQ